MILNGNLNQSPKKSQPTNNAMKQPIIYRIFGGYTHTEKLLADNGYKFTVVDIFSNFWGKEYSITTPTGKGSTAKFNALIKLLKL